MLYKRGLCLVYQNRSWTSITLFHHAPWDNMSALDIYVSKQSQFTSGSWKFCVIDNQ